ncbi:MAG: putative OsmC-like protein [Myxococcota bacterium]|jgi:uncharacterized OsmC-like protein
MTDPNSLVARRQDPLRTLYRADPSQALSYKEVRTLYTGATDAVHGQVLPAGFPEVAWDFGIDDTVGGFDDLPNPGHLLCAALAACMDSTVRMIADRLGVPVERLEVVVSGDADVRGCLAISRAVRPGFRQLQCRLVLELGPGVDPQVGAKLVQQAELLCVTLDTLRNGTPITVDFEAVHGTPSGRDATAQAAPSSPADAAGGS